MNCYARPSKAMLRRPVESGLAAPVRMEDQTRLGMAPEPGHAQRVGHQAGLHVGLHAPAHHLAAEQVDHCSQVQPAFVCGDVGDIAVPDQVRRLRNCQ